MYADGFYESMIEEKKLKRRCIGKHDMRLFGIEQLLSFAPEASVFDIGCNRGRISDEFARNGAKLVHGCDYYQPGIWEARSWFKEWPQVKCKFETVDLTGGGDALRKAFQEEYLDRYDIVVMLATYHKLKRQMQPDALNKLMLHIGKRVGKYFGWRGYPDEAKELDNLLGPIGLTRVHYSEIAKSMEPAAIWERK